MAKFEVNLATFVGGLNKNTNNVGACNVWEDVPTETAFRIYVSSVIG
jgi:hypothetical protein